MAIFNKFMQEAPDEARGAFCCALSGLFVLIISLTQGVALGFRVLAFQAKITYK